MFRQPSSTLRESQMQSTMQSTMQSITYVQFVVPLYAFVGACD